MATYLETATVSTTRPELPNDSSEKNDFASMKNSSKRPRDAKKGGPKTEPAKSHKRATTATKLDAAKRLAKKDAKPDAAAAETAPVQHPAPSKRSARAQRAPVEVLPSVEQAVETPSLDLSPVKRTTRQVLRAAKAAAAAKALKSGAAAGALDTPVRLTRQAVRALARKSRAEKGHPEKGQPEIAQIESASAEQRRPKKGRAESARVVPETPVVETTESDASAKRLTRRAAREVAAKGPEANAGLESRLEAMLADHLAARRSEGSSALTLNQILVRLEDMKPGKSEVLNALDRLTRLGKLVALKEQRWCSPARKGEGVGRLKSLPSGRVIAIFDPPLAARHGGEPIKEATVESEDLGTALGGDMARVTLLRASNGGSFGKTKARVLETLELGTTFVVGQYFGDSKGGKLVPNQRNLMGREVEVGRSGFNLKLENGQWAVANIARRAPWPAPLQGEISEVIGDYNDSHVDVTVLLRSRGCRESFPEEAEAEAAAFPDGLSKQEIARRRDLRGLLTFTIDGADSKDFDDAISIERVGADKWRLGVHIADVAHYVTEGSALNQEGVDRATSIYPLDRVVPMLPERLSNDLCSLVPKQDRPALTCLMDVRLSGEVESYELVESVIHSDFRLTYDQVQEMLDGHDAGKGAPKGFEKVYPALLECRQLSRGLVEMKKQRGALDLDVPEVKIQLDKEGRTIGLGTRARAESHRLIEEFMTLCNEVVGRHMRRHKLPALYRVHGEPNIEAVERLAPVLRGLGLAVSFKGEWTPKQIQSTLSKTEGVAGGHILRRLVLRAMQKAIYVPNNSGHFGLGSECYLHFTSPIRRYPDLIVHRVLKESLAPGGGSKELIAHFRDHMEDLGRHCSARERESMNIEYDAAALKSLEFMAPKVGETFEGFVSGVSRAGAFVELSPWPAEGMIPMRAMEGYWQHDEETMTLYESRTGRRLRIGDAVEVLLEKVDPLALKMDLKLLSGGRVSENEKKSGKGTTRKKLGGMADTRKKGGKSPFYAKAAKSKGRAKKKR
jgi:ribonuclease R